VLRDRDRDAAACDMGISKLRQIPKHFVLICAVLAFSHGATRFSGYMFQLSGADVERCRSGEVAMVLPDFIRELPAEGVWAAARPCGSAVPGRLSTPSQPMCQATRI
jgi:hypothetical protein